MNRAFIAVLGPYHDLVHNRALFSGVSQAVAGSLGRRAYAAASLRQAWACGFDVAHDIVGVTPAISG